MTDQNTALEVYLRMFPLQVGDRVRFRNGMIGRVEYATTNRHTYAIEICTLDYAYFTTVDASGRSRTDDREFDIVEVLPS